MPRRGFRRLPRIPRIPSFSSCGTCSLSSRFIRKVLPLSARQLTRPTSSRRRRFKGRWAPTIRRPLSAQSRPSRPRAGLVAWPPVRLPDTGGSAVTRDALRHPLTEIFAGSIHRLSKDARRARASMSTNQPGVVLMDIRMPNMDGLTAARHILCHSSSRVLVLTTFDADEYVYETLRIGASGFLLKDAPPEQLVGAVRCIAAGDALVQGAR